MIYLAGPLFTASELDFNRRLRDLLVSVGHDVWLPQEETSQFEEAAEILRALLKAMNAADIIVANMDGLDPDSGTSWECGYAFAIGKPTVLFRTDIRSRRDERLGPYNLMMWSSATVLLDGPYATVEEVAAALHPVLDLGALSARFKKQTSELLPTK